MIEEKNLCNKCPSDVRGMCCYFSYYDGKDNFIVAPCKYLNKKTRRCTIYKKRFELNPLCLTIEEMLSQGHAPQQCLYVQQYHGEHKLPWKTYNKIKLEQLIKKEELIKKNG